MIVLFPGSFNPIHLGHIQLAEYVLTQPNVDEVWFLVSPNNPLKEANTLWDEQFRLQLVQAAIQGKERMRVSDFEFALPRPSYTANTLRALAVAYPDKQFALLIGEDNMQVFDKWREHEWIAANYPIYVYPRENADSLSSLSYEGGRGSLYILNDAPLCPISSTEIRERLQQINNTALAFASDKVLCWLPKTTYSFFGFNNKQGENI